jgi:hypothetical protein
MKECRKCRLFLNRIFFPIRKRDARDHLSSWCYDCHAEANRRTRRRAASNTHRMSCTGHY